jgi:hypothetical protein
MGSSSNPLEYADRLAAAGLPNLSHQEAIRRLTGLAAGCSSCAGNKTEAPHRTKSVPVAISTLRHYSTRSPDQLQLISGTSDHASPVSPTAAMSEFQSGSQSPTMPSSPNTSFLSNFFGKSPGQGPGVATATFKIPPLWNDMHDHD